MENIENWQLLLYGVCCFGLGAIASGAVVWQLGKLAGMRRANEIMDGLMGGQRREYRDN